MEFGFNHGFTAALLKVREQLDSNFAEDLKRHKMRINAKTIEQAIDCMIEKVREASAPVEADGSTGASR